MSRSSVEALCRYFYDPLDRLVRAGASQRFYQQAHLVTELDDQAQRSILRHGAQPLAQQTAAAETRLLATDHAHSPLLAVSETLLQQISYTSYGHAPAESGLSRLLGFNGECPERVTGHYLLGQGTRAFNPVLMRFNSPDELSPFGEGGINPYAYCGGDPINFNDPTGNVGFRIDNLLRQTVIVKSPLRKIQRSSSIIARPNSPVAGPSRLQTAKRTNLQQASTSTSTSTLPPQKKPTASNINIQNNSNTSKPRDIKRKLKEDARRYDSYLAEHPGTLFQKNQELEEKLLTARDYLIQQTTAGEPAKTLEAIVSKIGYTELQIKRDAIRSIEETTRP